MVIDPSESIGRAIWTTGVYDIAVSELLFRLTSPGAVAVDAGANIGYMTGVLAVRTGPQGKVYAFEPNPVVADQLRENAARIGRLPGAARVEVMQLGLSDTEGHAVLAYPDGHAENQRLGYLTTGPRNGIEVETRRLDEIIGDGRLDVMKMDVEGHEPAVLRGAERLLVGRRIRHLVFEEHEGAGSETCRLLNDSGYRLFQIGWRINGPVLAPLTAPPVCRPFEAPSYLATVDAEGAITASRESGWRVFEGVK
jgi:FkbM family methyltransferase